MLRSILRVSVVSSCVLLSAEPLLAQEKMPSGSSEVPAVATSHIKHQVQTAPPVLAEADCAPPPVSVSPCPIPTSSSECAVPAPAVKHLFSRPRIVVDTQEPEIIFRRVPAAAVKSNSCNKGDACNAACAGNQSAYIQSAPAAAPASAPALAPAMTYASVPVVSYQMQMVPTVHMQTVAVPQQSAFITQAAATQPAAFFNQSFAQPQGAFIQPQAAGLGAGIGAALLENLLQGILANRSDPTDLINSLIKNRSSNGQTCPDQLFSDLTKQLKIANDKLSTMSPGAAANSDKVLESLTKMTGVIEKMSAKIEEHDAILKKLPKQ